MKIMQQYYGRNWNEIVGLLGSNINKGLLEYDCTLRRESYGDNVIDIGEACSNLSIFKEIVKKKYIYISILISIVFVLSGFGMLGLINLLLLIFNIGFKVYYEIKVDNKAEKLQSLNKSKVVVLREGIERLIEASELVKGDIVILNKNSFIAADLRVIKSLGLKVDEKSITGEEFIKEKYDNKIHGQASKLGEINNMLFRGSVIKEGSGMGIVVETGNSTELGKLMASIDKDNINKHNMLKKIEDIILKLMLCLILVEIILSLVLPGSVLNKTEIFMFGLFCIVNVCLPVIIILYGKEMKKEFLAEEVELINFSAFNLAKDIKVIFLDKYGTLTKEELYFEKMYTNEKILANRAIDIKDINVKRVLDISLLANDAKYNNDNNWTTGDIYEIAYVKYCTEQRIFKSNIEGKNTRKFQIPKDTNKNVVTTVNKTEKGYRANCRGTVDGVLDFCTHILVNGIERSITSQDIEKIKLTDLCFSREGLLTEAFAYRSFSYEPSKSENIESNLVFVGLVALENLFVEGVTEDIERLMENGVLPIMITDDNKIVAEIIGRKIGLVSSSKEVISGIELSSLSEKELYKVISRTRVFCRLTPELKTKIISIFNEDGFKVAVEGETLGDLSVVNSAHLSIVKGQASSLVKQCADLYIKGNALKAFFKIVEDGFRVDEAIKNAIKVYSTLVICQIIALNFFYAFVDERLFGAYTIVFMNFILLTPIILLVMNCGKEEINSKKKYLRVVLFSAMPLLSIYLLGEFNEFAAFMIIGGMLIVYGIVNSHISIRSFNIGIKLLIISILIYIAGCFLIGFMGTVVYSKNLMVTIGGLIFIYLIGDLIITNWQDS
ncbi:MAG: HAD-IC family P-type ATPase [Clostridium sp.]